jgi:hypothetical protein
LKETQRKKKINKWRKEKDGALERNEDMNSRVSKEIEKKTKTVGEEPKRSGVEEIKKLRDNERKKDCH